LETQLIQKEERALYWSQGTSLYDKYYQQLEEDINQIDYFDMPLLDSTIDAKKAELNSSEIDSKAPLVCSTKFRNFSEFNGRYFFPC